MSKLTFYSAKELAIDMQAKGVEKEHFAFTYAEQTLDCIFSKMDKYYELLVAVHTLNFGFIVTLIQSNTGNFIAEITDDDYFNFCKAMNLSYKGDGFNSNTLLNLLSSHIPPFSKGVKISYKEMRQYTKCRYVDEADKIYFCGWNDHIIDKRKAQNFDKTEFYLGVTVANYCRKNNISSMWSNIPRDEKNLTDPWNR